MPSNRIDSRDRRAEERSEAHGPVILKSLGVPPLSANGKLVDIAKSGFRARHGMRSLSPGAEVHFEIGGLPGRARVVWTRILGDLVESGFLILPEDGA